MTNRDKPFKRVGLYTRLADTTNQQIIQFILEILADIDIQAYICPDIPATNLTSATQLPLKELAKTCDLLIAVGGDGSILDAARFCIDSDTAILGINRGYMGFLSDLLPDDLTMLRKILLGTYIEDKRNILSAYRLEDQQEHYLGSALNEILLTRGDVLRILEFDLYINDTPICHYRADGMIIATSTGSTAYALSAGGAIVHPDLETISLVPLNPHSLTSRPIIIGHHNRIQLVLQKTFGSIPYVLCDGHSKSSIDSTSRLEIRQSPHKIRIIHPDHYTFFETLQTKLHWEHKPHAHLP